MPLIKLFINSHLPSLSSFTFVLAGTSLLIWILRVEKPHASHWRTLALISLLGHIFLSIMAGFSSRSIAIPITDLFLLGCIGIGTIIFRSFVKKNSLVTIPMVIGVTLLLRGPYKNIVKLTQAESTGAYAEYLVEIPKQNLTEFHQKYKPYIHSLEKAFHSPHIANTNLDEYYALNIKDHELDVFRSLLGDINYCDWIEENEQIQISPLEVPNSKIINTKNGLPFNDPELQRQWALERINIAGIINFLTQNRPQKKALLAILDTGVESQHEDLRENYITLPGSATEDRVGHGTHCAGIAGAIVHNGIGVASPLIHQQLYQITGFKVLNDFGGGTQQSIIQGIISAVDRDADVISMSLGGLSSDKRQRAYNEAIKYANKQGAIVVVAAGNASQDARRFAPANAENVLCVGAVDEDNQPASFSNDISNIKYGIYAPGTNIVSTYKDNSYRSFNGTSMATPYVSSLVAILKAYAPNITTEEAYTLMQKNLPADLSGNRPSTQQVSCIDFSAALNRLTNSETALY